MITTFRYRIKDSGSTKKKLNKMASGVNYIWNFCKETQSTALKNKPVKIITDPKTKKIYYTPYFFTQYEMNELVAGSSKELGLHSQSVQAVAEEYITRRKQFKKLLRWRGRNSLGWIPFKSSGIKIKKDEVQYNKQKFKFWNSRKLPSDALIKSGSFAQDNCGRWYLNITLETKRNLYNKNSTSESVMFLSNYKAITYNDSIINSRPVFPIKLKLKIKKLNIAKKKRIVLRKKDKIKEKSKPISKREKIIINKITNIKQDFFHKESTKIINSNAVIITNEILSAKKRIQSRNSFISTRLNMKHFQNILCYKAIRAGKVVSIVSNKNLSLVPFKCCSLQPQFILRKRTYVCKICNKRTPFITSARNNLYLAAKHLFRIGHDTP
ncbi:hypothetical protein QEJ31_13245 [Pigmentibacter sp. JX0631]|uniref:hypothetical protein n=1 Tax=Pigmentibacter sp. JX0631 TaxID=2976982 RepID=UPI0024692E46|nr:hypothetical protein [Pigmentibacter sp. JX0631]WGL59489.1 hypothetical protein QEJ31_13245 [Pigmentibacter sp. JX0631]